LASLVNETAVPAARGFSPLLVIAATACVAYADYVVRSISLGYLYVVPLCLGAVLLNRRRAFVLIAICVVFHDLFGPAYPSLSTRVVHNLTAAAGFAVVVAVIQSFVAQRNALYELTRRQRDELMKDVELAAQVQRMFLPVAEPVVPGFDIAGVIRPAKGLSGDYYDYIPVPDGRLELAIADVSGRGVPAALLMAATAAVVHLETRESRHLEEIVARLNRELYGRGGGFEFVTLLLGELQPEQRRLRYVNCGHNPGLLVRASISKVFWLPALSVPVGMFPVLECQPAEITFRPGDVLVWYTDGLTEATDRRGIEFGEDRLAQVVLASMTAGARAIAEQVCEAVRRYTGRQGFEDDCTVVVIKACPVEA
jgi:phosphoserine phosphatase RsbU/P